MPAMLNALARFFALRSADAPNSDERFLAEAVDLQDLEMRMRQLDRGRRELSALGPFGIALK